MRSRVLWVERVRDVCPHLSDLVYLASQACIAVLVALMFTIDDGPDDGSFLRQHFLLTCAASQVLGMCAGVWQGARGSSGRRRIVLCAIPVAALVAWWIVWTPGVAHLLVWMPAVAGAATFSAPSWLAVGCGMLISRRQRTLPAVMTDA